MLVEKEVDITKLNEEINLLYVAVTRARNHLYVPEDQDVHIPTDFIKVKGDKDYSNFETSHNRDTV